VPALERVAGVRVVADPAALDAAVWTGDGVSVLRIAPDEALAIGATAVAVDDPEAIVEPEGGMVAARLSAVELAPVARHIEWALPVPRPALAQGKVAGVPARLVLDGDGGLLVTHAAYAHELEERLGWR
jgi:hypothetical protein